MKTPIADFVSEYARTGGTRLHMPGHKGVSLLGCEPLDITEIKGADDLFSPEGIIAESERNATALFGTGQTLYSTEGATLPIKAMLALAVQNAPKAGGRPRVLAARNAHKSFVYGCGLLDIDVTWLFPKKAAHLCSCPVSADEVDVALSAADSPFCAVFLTSPDYLGRMVDISRLAACCHSLGVKLLVDNAHGAYLRFLSPSRHPMDLGADLCCDSAHKTLPVLTGGAYLHISKGAPVGLEAHAKAAMALFGSTSPSSLLLCSLDLCNRELAGNYPAKLAATVKRLDALCARMKDKGWVLTHDEPLKVTIHASRCGLRGTYLADQLRRGGVECEYADGDDVVLMASPGNTAADFERILEAAGLPGGECLSPMPLPAAAGAQKMSVRDAVFAPAETIAVADAVGRICASPTVSCPPAIPIAVSGEEITAEVAEMFLRYGVDRVDVVCCE